MSAKAVKSKWGIAGELVLMVSTAARSSLRVQPQRDYNATLGRSVEE